MCMNGPGGASIGITGGGNNNHMLYINGNKKNKIKKRID